MSDFVQRMRLAGGLRTGMRLYAAQSLVRHQVSMFTGAIWKEPSRIVWTNMGMPPELFYAAGYLPVNTELTAGWSSTLNLAAKYLAIAEQKGFGQNLCSYHKAIVGAMECGDLPPPRLAVMSSHICDGGRGLLSYFASRFRPRHILFRSHMDRLVRTAAMSNGSCRSATAKSQGQCPGPTLWEASDRQSNAPIRQGVGWPMPMLCERRRCCFREMMPFGTYLGRPFCLAQLWGYRSRGSTVNS